jgi:hypothetical protein
MIDNNTRAAVAEDRKQIAERIRERARLFQADNGDPGALASTWGWRTIASELRSIADEVEGVGAASMGGGE